MADPDTAPPADNNNTVVLTRHAELDLAADELWNLVATADGWRQWLCDDTEIIVEQEAIGLVSDDGIVRRVTIDQISRSETGEGRVAFRWAPIDDDGSTSATGVSHVELHIVPVGNQLVLRVTETFPSTTSLASPSLSRAETRWELRLLMLLIDAATLMHT